MEDRWLLGKETWAGITLMAEPLCLLWSHTQQDQPCYWSLFACPPPACESCFLISIGSTGWNFIMVIFFFNIIRWYLISDFAVLLTWINAAIVTGIVSTAAQFAWEISNLTGGQHGYPNANSWEKDLCVSLGPFSGCRKDGGLASGSRAAAVVRASAAGEPLKILRLNFILQIEYKHRGFFGFGKQGSHYSLLG